MRVKIAYTVELENVEKEVADIISRATNDTDDALQVIARLQNELKTQMGNREEQLKNIHFARIKLAKADQILEDCFYIIQGVEEAMKKQEEEENEIQDG